MCSQASKKRIIENTSLSNIEKLKNDYKIQTKKVTTVGEANKARSFSATFSPVKKYYK